MRLKHSKYTSLHGKPKFTAYEIKPKCPIVVEKMCFETQESIFRALAKELLDILLNTFQNVLK